MILQNEFCHDYAIVSPDGRWIAYESNLSGSYEIYIERYPDRGGRQQISTGGGRLPVWSHDGRELVYSSADGRQMLAVQLQSGTTMVAGRPQVLFEGAYPAVAGGIRPYDRTPDGRFVMLAPSSESGTGGGAAPTVVLVQNWLEELRRLAPRR